MEPSSIVARGGGGEGRLPMSISGEDGRVMARLDCLLLLLEDFLLLLKGFDVDTEKETNEWACERETYKSIII